MDDLTYHQLQRKCTELKIKPCKGTQDVLLARIKTFLASREQEMTKEEKSVEMEKKSTIKPRKRAYQPSSEAPTADISIEKPTNESTIDLADLSPWERAFATENPSLYSSIVSFVRNMPDVRALTKAKSEMIREELSKWNDEARWKTLYEELKNISQVERDAEILDMFNRIEEGEDDYSGGLLKLKDRYLASDSLLVKATPTDALQSFLLSYPALSWLLTQTHPSARIPFLINGYIDWLFDKKTRALLIDLPEEEKIDYASAINNEDLLAILLKEVDLNAINFYTVVLYNNSALLSYLLDSAANGERLLSQNDRWILVDSADIKRLQKMVKYRISSKELHSLSLIHWNRYREDSFRWILHHNAYYGNYVSMVLNIAEQNSSLLTIYLEEIASEMKNDNLLIGTNFEYVTQLAFVHAIKHGRNAFAINLIEAGLDPTAQWKGSMSDLWYYDDPFVIAIQHDLVVAKYLFQHYGDRLPNKGAVMRTIYNLFPEEKEARYTALPPDLLDDVKRYRPSRW